MVSASAARIYGRSVVAPMILRLDRSCTNITSFKFSVRHSGLRFSFASAS